MISEAWQEQIIKDLIKEDPDATLKDFLKLKAELERIHASTLEYPTWKIKYLHHQLKQAS